MAAARCAGPREGIFLPLRTLGLVATWRMAACRASARIALGGSTTRGVQSGRWKFGEHSSERQEGAGHGGPNKRRLSAAAGPLLVACAIFFAAADSPRRDGRTARPAARIARSGLGRCAAARRDVRRRPAGLGRRRPRRHLAHRRRRPPLGAANFGSRLPTVGRRVRRRPARLGRGRMDQTVQPRHARRLAGDATTAASTGAAIAI